MKKMGLILFFSCFLGFLAFGGTDEKEEIDFMLFQPNLSNEFVNQAQANIQLDKLAKTILDRKLTTGQIYVYGYAAVAENDIDPIDLSNDRAVFIINELQKRGVPKGLFSNPVGLGSVNLWGDNTNEDGRQPNRRTRILVDQPSGTVIGGGGSGGGGVDDPGKVEAGPQVPTVKQKGGSGFFGGIKSILRWILIILLILVVIALTVYLLSKTRGLSLGGSGGGGAPRPSGRSASKPQYSNNNFSTKQATENERISRKSEDKKGSPQITLGKKFAEYASPDIKEPTNTGALQPNTIYRQVETSGTEHQCFTKTDLQGRVREVFSPKLHKSVGGRTPKHMLISDLENAGYRGHTRPGDEGGHLIADSVGGSRYNDNVVPMKGELNRGAESPWLKMERDVRQNVEAGRNVENFRVQVRYGSSGSKRPSEFVVTYDLDGVHNHQNFSNE